VVALLAAALSVAWYSSAKKRLATQRNQYGEIVALKDQFLSLRREVKLVEGRKHLANVKGIVEAVDQVFNPLGLKEKVQSVKPLTTKDKNEEKAEVEVKGVDLNEMVNILYNIENAPMLLVTRKMSLKTSFENPNQLNMTLTLSLVLPEQK
jgi:hypothetical protein